MSARGSAIDVALAVASVAGAWAFVGYPTVIKGRSMQPTFRACCDVVWVNKLPRREPLRVGQVVVAKNPKQKGNVVKRVLAVEGEQVNLERGRGVLTVPPGHVWLQGDNPKFSVDSRTYGPVPVDSVVGVASVRLWSEVGRVPLEVPECNRWVRRVEAAT